MDALFNSQIGIFLIYFIAGVIICLIYDIFRALRKTVNTSDFATYIEDTIFWILVAVFLIYLVFNLSSGEIRFFMFLAICLGGISYYFTLSKYFMKVSVHILSLIKLIVKKLIEIILIPLKVFLKINKKVKCIICINLKNIKKNINQKSKIVKNKQIEDNKVKKDKKQTKLKSKIKLEKFWQKSKKKVEN